MAAATVPKKAAPRVLSSLGRSMCGGGGGELMLASRNRQEHEVHKVF